MYQLFPGSVQTIRTSPALKKAQHTCDKNIFPLYLFSSQTTASTREPACLQPIYWAPYVAVRRAVRESDRGVEGPLFISWPLRREVGLQDVFCRFSPS